MKMYSRLGMTLVLPGVAGASICVHCGDAFAQNGGQFPDPAMQAEIVSQARTRLQGLVDRLGGVEACSLRADVEVLVYQSPPGVLEENAPEVGVPIHGVFEFDASGDAWRKRSYLDPELYPGMDTEIAYNGELYQYGIGNRVLSVEQGDDNRIGGMALPNPLAALGQFLIPLTDDNDITLSRLRGACIADACSRADWSVTSAQDGAIAVAAFPGFEVDGQPYTMHVLIDGAAQEPIVMEAVNGAGAVLYRTTFDTWTSVTSWNGKTEDWPAHVLFEVPNPATGANLAEMEMVLTQLAFPPLAEDATTAYFLDWDAANHVWVGLNEESGTFVK